MSKKDHSKADEQEDRIAACKLRSINGHSVNWGAPVTADTVIEIPAASGEFEGSYVLFSTDPEDVHYIVFMYVDRASDVIKATSKQPTTTISFPQDGLAMLVDVVRKYDQAFLETDINANYRADSKDEARRAQQREAERRWEHRHDGRPHSGEGPGGGDGPPVVIKPKP